MLGSFTATGIIIHKNSFSFSFVSAKSFTMLRYGKHTNRKESRDGIN